MIDDERWQRIEAKHQALTESIELLTLDIRAMQKEQRRLDLRERRARQALMAGFAAYLKVLQEDDVNGDQA